MTYLADVNVWLALTLVDHVHHLIAFRWFSESSPDKIVFCRITQMGFLRLLTNSKAMDNDPIRPVGAWKLFDALRYLDRIGYVEEPLSLEHEWRKAADGRPTGPNSWTDAYLGAFATAAGLTIATFDKGFAKRMGLRAHLLG